MKIILPFFFFVLFLPLSFPFFLPPPPQVLLVREMMSRCLFRELYLTLIQYLFTYHQPVTGEASKHCSYPLSLLSLRILIIAVA